MATKDELTVENAELKAALALHAGAAAWLAAAGLTVSAEYDAEGKVTEYILCVGGLPATGTVFEGQYEDGVPMDESFDETPDMADAAGLALVNGVTATGADLYLYKDGIGFVRLRDGEEFPATRPEGAEAPLTPVGQAALDAAVQKAQMLETDLFNTRARLAEQRDVSAALQQRLDNSNMLHGSIDSLRPVV